MGLSAKRYGTATYINPKRSFKRVEERIGAVSKIAVYDALRNREFEKIEGRYRMRGSREDKSAA